MRLDELLSLLPLGFFRGLVVIFGLLWGSFLNVVIYRVPREMSVVRPASHCPGCGKPIKGYDNVPVLGYVLLLGKTRCCKTRMSPRYPLVELMGGLLSLAIFEVVILALPGATPIGRALAVYGADFALCLGLVAAAFIDAEHMFLPDSITIGGTVLGLATATVRDLGFQPAATGAVVGFLVIWLPFIFLYKGLLGRTGMGMGDAKLLALAGAWFGWPGTVFVLIAGALQGTIYAGVTSALGIEQKLPDAVLADIAELEAQAANGDEEAKRALAEDPLTEDEDDAFIVDFFRRVLALPKKEEEPELEGPPTEEEVAESNAEEHRLRIPFGPFLILALLELLFAGDWLRLHVFTMVWPGF